MNWISKHKGVLLAALALVLLGGIFAIARQKQATGPGPVYCTQEAKLCPDGSYVGRTGPKCEFAACPGVTSTPPGGGQGIAPYDSGIRGKVMLGPTCPVQRIPPDPACADKPYRTLVAIFRASDPVHAFVLTESGADGTFSAALPPGEYTIGAGESYLPRCGQAQVTVEPGKYASADISCDTGIR